MQDPITCHPDRDATGLRVRPHVPCAQCVPSAGARVARGEAGHLLPYSYWSNRQWNDPTKNDSDLQPTEVKFQLSLKAPIKEEIVDDITLWMAFTGTFYWQAYNSELSAPFHSRQGTRVRSGTSLQVF